MHAVLETAPHGSNIVVVNAKLARHCFSGNSAGKMRVQRVNLCAMQAVLAAGPNGVNSLVAQLLQSHEEEKGKAMAGPLPLHTVASSSSTSTGMFAYITKCAYHLV